jgi:hypothetical protein
MRSGPVTFGARSDSGEGRDMAGSWDVWTSDRDGTLRAEAHGFRLVVHPAKADAAAVRFGVMRRGCDGDGPIGSGQAGSVRAAMKAAIEMAERFARPLPKDSG